MNYQKTVFIEYPNGGNLFDELRGKQWALSGTADLKDPGVQTLLTKLNEKILSEFFAGGDMPTTIFKIK